MLSAMSILFGLLLAFIHLSDGQLFGWGGYSSSYSYSGQPYSETFYGTPYYQTAYSPMQYRAAGMSGPAGQCRVISYLGIDQWGYPYYQCHCSNTGYFQHHQKTKTYAPCANNLPTTAMQQSYYLSQTTKYTPYTRETTYPYYTITRYGWG